MDMENLNGEMEDNIKECGKMVYNMEKEYIVIKIKKKLMENGLEDKEDEYFLIILYYFIIYFFIKYINYYYKVSIIKIIVYKTLIFM